ncbi:hypothetical protein B0T16DRAFT_211519 [Cercophora newfieldiana]|uniref:Uncharacterized protein n=1 Tax=Cercophora newfieldiana TaxID=92897 RepID=A0AA39XVV8_9PEZI|nr:hypothetical protein B0T16DRAFT_211519 [Cercophora newfieldiana]
MFSQLFPFLWAVWYTLSLVPGYTCLVFPFKLDFRSLDLVCLLLYVCRCYRLALNMGPGSRRFLKVCHINAYSGSHCLGHRSSWFLLV